MESFSLRTFFIPFLICVYGYYAYGYILAVDTSSTTLVKSTSIEGFTTFRDNMAKSMKISGTLLDSKEVQDWYKANVVDTGKVIDYKDTQQMNTITTTLLSMLCAACSGNCTCLIQLGCAGAQFC